MTISIRDPDVSSVRAFSYFFCVRLTAFSFVLNLFEFIFDYISPLESPRSCEALLTHVPKIKSSGRFSTFVFSEDDNHLHQIVKNFTQKNSFIESFILYYSIYSIGFYFDSK